MGENHRRLVTERIDLLWRARAVLVLARERMVAGRWTAGREAVRAAGDTLRASNAVLMECLRLSGRRAVEGERVGDDLEGAVGQCSAEILELENELKEASTRAHASGVEVRRAWLQ